jgi:hypothetical protein
MLLGIFIKKQYIIDRFLNVAALSAVWKIYIYVRSERI